MNIAQTTPVEPVAPASSPWGTPQSSTRLASGIWSITTSSHGGIWLSPERNADVPDYMADATGWYEEDLAWAVPAVVYPEAFRDNIGAAIRILRVYMPDAYERFTGDTVAPGESYIRDRSVFHRDNPQAWLVHVAWSDATEWVDPGHFGVSARQGEPGTAAYVASPERFFMIEADEYVANWSLIGFQIDQSRHREVERPDQVNARRRA